MLANALNSGGTVPVKRFPTSFLFHHTPHRTANAQNRPGRVGRIVRRLAACIRAACVCARALTHSCVRLVIKLHSDGRVPVSLLSVRALRQAKRDDHILEPLVLESWMTAATYSLVMLVNVLNSGGRLPDKRFESIFLCVDVGTHTPVRRASGQTHAQVRKAAIGGGEKKCVGGWCRTFEWR
jgi:predicted NBD/HSP70 family sugar kinase